MALGPQPLAELNKAILFFRLLYHLGHGTDDQGRIELC